MGFFLPIGALPSPPPWGWSTGFITTPLTTGRLPSQRLDPALPKLLCLTPTFPTCPTVAEQFLDIKRTSPEGNFNVADFPSFAISFATAPAAPYQKPNPNWIFSLKGITVGCFLVLVKNGKNSRVVVEVLQEMCTLTAILRFSTSQLVFVQINGIDHTKRGEKL